MSVIGKSIPSSGQYAFVYHRSPKWIILKAQTASSYAKSVTISQYTRRHIPEGLILQGVQLKSGPILIWVIHLLRFTTCYITQLTCIYSKCWKWCPFISMHLSTRFTMFLATFLSVLPFFNNFRNSTFYWRLPSKFFKETLSTVGVRHRF